MTQMLICRLTHCPGHDKATVVLEDVDRRLEFAFLIPMHEAYGLARALGLARCTCVPVLELIDGLLAYYNARVLRAVLDEDEAGIVAMLHVGETDGEAAFPCHPADALALAARTCAPIYATDEVLHHARLLGQSHGRGTGHPDSARYPGRARPEGWHYRAASPVPRHEPLASPASRPQRKRITTADLMQGAREITILHQGEEYLLRITKIGKLILTK